MIGRGLVVLTMLSSCVLSLPAASSQLENEDVEVMKCIVEALADVLSRPHPMPVSQECLVILKTDDRLVTILRHRNFLKELQEIAVQGGQERAQLQRDAAAPEPSTPTPQTADVAADRSMLEALGGPGERSILSQKRGRGKGDGEGEEDESLRDGDYQGDNEIFEEGQVKREDDEGPGSHVSESADQGSEGEAEKREEEEDEEFEEKRANSKENPEEENMSKDKKGAASNQKRDAPGNKSKEKRFDEDEEEKDKRSAFFTHKQGEEEGEMKRGSRESLKRWTKRGKGLQLKKKASGKEVQQLSSQQEVPHHSKEVTEDEGEMKKRDTQRSPEEKELQMIARGAPEERRGLEEEGSASRKPEEPEIESLAAIESELENVAQKLHELRQG